MLEEQANYDVQEGDTQDAGMGIQEGKGAEGYSWEVMETDACLALNPSPEPESPPPALQGSGDRLAHHAGVLAALQVSSTQHELCHLLEVGTGTHLIGQDSKVHTLEVIWVSDYGPGRNTAVARPHPLSSPPPDSGV